MKKFIALSFLLCFICGCADIPIKDGGLAVGANTNATVEDLGVAKIRNKF